MDRTYRIHVVAEMTGLTEGLIRAWERRYSVLTPKRTPSGYRAYTEADVDLLRRLKTLTEEGVSISEAVKLLPRLRREVKAALESRSTESRPPKPDQLRAWQTAVLEAARNLDQQAIETTLDEAMASLPPVAFFDDVLVPLQVEVGERWHAGTLTIAEEHLVTQAARQRVMTLLHRAPRRAKHHIVCACFPKEDHELGLMGVALRFRHAGWRVTFLGARTPVEHLGQVVERVAPDAVALSCVQDPGAEAFEKELEAFAKVLPKGVTVLVGGAAARVHEKAVISAGLTTAVSEADWSRVLDA